MHIDHGHAARASSARVECGIDVTAARGYDSQVAEGSGAGNLHCTDEGQADRINEGERGRVPRMLTTSMRSEGVSITDSG